MRKWRRSLYLVVYPGGAFLATSLEVALGFFEGVHKRPMRALARPGRYTYEVYPDFPGVGWGRVGVIADLGLQKPEEVPLPPAFPLAVSNAWGNDK